VESAHRIRQVLERHTTAAVAAALKAYKEAAAKAEASVGNAMRQLSLRLAAQLPDVINAVTLCMVRLFALINEGLIDAGIG
jgi:hypothetical protein